MPRCCRSLDFGRWWAALLFGLMLLFLLLIAAWLLRTFAPVAPTIKPGAVQMPPPTAPVGVPDPMLALNALLDDMRNVEKGTQGRTCQPPGRALRKRLEQCKPSQPPLPAERWSKGDLGTLNGCWVLGRTSRWCTALPDGRKEQSLLRPAGSALITMAAACTSRSRLGRRQVWNCKAPMTAKFWSNGTLGGQPACRRLRRRATYEMGSNAVHLPPRDRRNGALPGRRQERPRTQVEIRRER